MALVLASHAQEKAPRTMDREERVNARVERLTTELGLDAGQADRIRQLYLKHSLKMSSLREVPEGAERRTMVRELQMAKRQVMREVLTAEQLARYQALRTKDRKAMRGETQKTPSERAEATAHRMRAELGLDDGQRVALKTVLERNAERLSGIRATHAEASEERRAAVAAALEQRRTEVMALLTPDQQQRWAALKAERAAKRGTERGR